MKGSRLKSKGRFDPILVVIVDGLIWWAIIVAVREVLSR
jgi:hypothetical protein